MPLNRNALNRRDRLAYDLEHIPEQLKQQSTDEDYRALLHQTPGHMSTLLQGPPGQVAARSRRYLKNIHDPLLQMMSDADEQERAERERAAATAAPAPAPTQLVEGPAGRARRDAQGRVIVPKGLTEQQQEFIRRHVDEFGTPDERERGINALFLTPESRRRMDFVDPTGRIYNIHNPLDPYQRNGSSTVQDLTSRYTADRTAERKQGGSSTVRDLVMRSEAERIAAKMAAGTATEEEVRRGIPLMQREWNGGYDALDKTRAASPEQARLSAFKNYWRAQDAAADGETVEPEGEAPAITDYNNAQTAENVAALTTQTAARGMTDEEYYNGQARALNGGQPVDVQALTTGVASTPYEHTEVDLATVVPGFQIGETDEQIEQRYFGYMHGNPRGLERAHQNGSDYAQAQGREYDGVITTRDFFEEYPLSGGRTWTSPYHIWLQTDPFGKIYWNSMGQDLNVRDNSGTQTKAWELWNEQIRLGKRKAQEIAAYGHVTQQWMDDYGKFLLDLNGGHDLKWQDVLTTEEKVAVKGLGDNVIRGYREDANNGLTALRVSQIAEHVQKGHTQYGAVLWNQEYNRVREQLDTVKSMLTYLPRNAELKEAERILTANLELLRTSAVMFAPDFAEKSQVSGAVYEAAMSGSQREWDRDDLYWGVNGNTAYTEATGTKGKKDVGIRREPAVYGMDWSMAHRYDQSRRVSEDNEYRMNWLDDIISWNGENDVGLYMRDDQKAIFNYLYAAQGPAAAQEYLKQIKNYLMAQRRVGEQKYTQRYSQEHPVLSTINAVVAMPYASLRSMTGMVLQAGPSSSWFDLSNMRGTAKQTVGEMAETAMPGWGHFIYDTGVSTLESVYSQVLGASFGAAIGAGAFSATARAAGIYFMSAEGAGVTYQSMLDSNHSHEYATIRGLVSGGVEFASEMIGMDWTMRKIGMGNTLLTRTARGIFAGGVAEALEEGWGWAADIVFDLWINEGYSELTELQRQKYVGYIAQGMDDTEAWGKSWSDVWDEELGQLLYQMGVAGASGGAAGGLLGMRTHFDISGRQREAQRARQAGYITENQEKALDDFYDELYTGKYDGENGQLDLSKLDPEKAEDVRLGLNTMALLRMYKTEQKKMEAQGITQEMYLAMNRELPSYANEGWTETTKWLYRLDIKDTETMEREAREALEAGAITEDEFEILRYRFGLTDEYGNAATTNSRATEQIWEGIEKNEEHKDEYGWNHWGVGDEESSAVLQKVYDHKYTNKVRSAALAEEGVTDETISAAADDMLATWRGAGTRSTLAAETEAAAGSIREANAASMESARQEAARLREEAARKREAARRADEALQGQVAQREQADLGQAQQAAAQLRAAEQGAQAGAEQYGARQAAAAQGQAQNAAADAAARESARRADEALQGRVGQAEQETLARAQAAAAAARTRADTATANVGRIRQGLENAMQRAAALEQELEDAAAPQVDPLNMKTGDKIVLGGRHARPMDQIRYETAEAHRRAQDLQQQLAAAEQEARAAEQEAARLEAEAADEASAGETFGAVAEATQPSGQTAAGWESSPGFALGREDAHALERAQYFAGYFPTRNTAMYHMYMWAQQLREAQAQQQAQLAEDYNSAGAAYNEAAARGDATAAEAIRQQFIARQDAAQEGISNLQDQELLAAEILAMLHDMPDGAFGTGTETMDNTQIPNQTFGRVEEQLTDPESEARFSNWIDGIYHNVLSMFGVERTGETAAQAGTATAAAIGEQAGQLAAQAGAERTGAAAAEGVRGPAERLSGEAQTAADATRAAREETRGMVVAGLERLGEIHSREEAALKNARDLQVAEREMGELRERLAGLGRELRANRGRSGNSDVYRMAESAATVTQQLLTQAEERVAMLREEAVRIRQMSAAAFGEAGRQVANGVAEANAARAAERTGAATAGMAETAARGLRPAATEDLRPVGEAGPVMEATDPRTAPPRGLRPAATEDLRTRSTIGDAGGDGAQGDTGSGDRTRQTEPETQRGPLGDFMSAAMDRVRMPGVENNGGQTVQAVDLNERTDTEKTGEQPVQEAAEDMADEIREEADRTDDQKTSDELNKEADDLERQADEIMRALGENVETNTETAEAGAQAGTQAGTQTQTQGTGRRGGTTVGAAGQAGTEGPGARAGFDLTHDDLVRLLNAQYGRTVMPAEEMRRLMDKVNDAIHWSQRTTFGAWANVEGLGRVSLQGFETTGEDAQVRVETKDGETRTVPLKKVNFGENGVWTRMGYERAAAYDDVDTARNYLAGYERTQLDPFSYDHAFSGLYSQGLSGTQMTDRQRVAAGMLESNLRSMIANAARRGRIGQAQQLGITGEVSQAQNMLDSTIAKAGSTEAASREYTGVVQDFTVQLSPAQRMYMEQLNQMARWAGMKITLTDQISKHSEVKIDPEKAGMNGFFRKGTNEVVIDVTALEGAATLTAYHEAWHFVKQEAAHDPELAKEVARFEPWINRTLQQGKGYNLEQRIKETQQLYSPYMKRDMTRDEALEEIHADALRRMGDRGKALETTAKGVSEFTGVFGKIQEVLSKWKGYVQRCLRKLGKRSAEVRAMLEANEQEIDKGAATFDMLMQGAGAVYAARTERGNQARESEGEKFSIQELADGTKYVEVDTDQDIFDGVAVSEYSKIATKYIKDHFRGIQITENTDIRVTARTAEEYGRRNTRSPGNDAYIAKRRAATELNNLIAVSTPLPHVDDNGKHPEAVGGWDYYRTVFRVSGRFFEGVLNVMNRQHDRVFYDMTDIKDITAHLWANNPILAVDVLDKSINQDTEAVKEQLSLSERGSEFSEAERDRLLEEYRDAQGELNQLRQRYRELREGDEYKTWMDRVSEAAKSGDMSLLDEYKAWEDQSGLAKTKHALDEAEKRYEAANKAYDDFTERRDVAEEGRRIRESGLDEQGYRRKQAVSEFGLTTNFREAGYLMPDGKMLNFSGEKGRHSGHRGQDHRAIGNIYASREMQGWRAMNAFMGLGNIRVMAETPGIDICTATEPTAEQYSKIRSMAQQFAREEYFCIDLTDINGDNIGTLEYDGKINPTRIINDIKNYYATGEIADPSQSLDRFRFSLSEREELMHPDGPVEELADLLRYSFVSDVEDGTVNPEIQRLMSENQKLLGRAERAERELESERKAGEETRRENTRLRNGVETARALKENAQMHELVQQITAQMNDWRGENAVDERQVAKMARQIRRGLETTVPFESLKKDLTGIFQAMAEAKTPAESKAAIQALSDLVLYATYQSSHADRTMYDQYKDARDMIRGMTMTPEEWKLIDDTVGDFASFRKLYFGKLGLRSGTASQGMHIEDVYSALHDQYGEIFPDDNMSVGDKLGRLMAFMDETDIKYYNPHTEENPENRGVDTATYVASDMTMQLLREFMTGGRQVSGKNEARMANIERLMTGTQEALNETRQLTERGQGAWAKQYRDTLQKLRAELQTSNFARTEAETRARTAEDLVQRAQRQATAAQEAATTARRQAREATARAEAAEGAARNSEAVEAAETRARDAERRADRAERRAERAEDRAERARQEERQRQQEIRRRQAERRAANQDRQKLVAEINRKRGSLMKKLERGNVSSGWVPTAMRDAVTKLLTALDFENQITATAALTPELLQQAKAAYEALGKEKMPDGARGPMASYYNGDLAAEFDELLKTAAGKTVRQLTDDEVRRIRDIVSGFAAAVINADRVFTQTRSESLHEMGDTMLRQSGERITRYGEHRVQGTLARWTADAMRRGLLKPTTVFGEYEGTALGEIWHNLRNAENTHIRNITEAGRFFAEMVKKYHQQESIDTEATENQRWGRDRKRAKSREFTLADGQKVRLTDQELMTLYAWQKREARMGTNHLLGGGFTLRNQARGGAMGEYRVNQADLERFSEALTAEQKAYVDEMVDYLSTTVGEWGNVVSEALYGVSKFTETYYLPFTVDKIYVGDDPGQAQDARLKVASFTKSLTNKASTTLKLAPFTQLWTAHVEQMSDFNAFTLPIEDMTRVLNYRESLYDDKGNFTGYGRSARPMMQRAWGKQSVDYIHSFLSRLNGNSRQEAGGKWINRFLSSAKGAAVTFNLRVALQQAGAGIRALAEMSTRDVLPGMANGLRFKSQYNELMEYAPIAVEKSWGYFDTNMKNGLYDRQRNTLWGRIQNAGGKLAQWGDEFNWAQIWGACKHEARRQNPGLSEEEIKQKAAERFTEVIDRTQVVDSVFQRSEWATEKGMTKNLMSFLSEPVTMYNMIYRRVAETYRAFKIGDGRADAVRSLVRSTSAIVLSSAMTALLASLGDGERDRDNDKKVKDENGKDKIVGRRTYWDKVGESFGANMLDNLLGVGTVFTSVIQDMMGTWRSSGGLTDAWVGNFIDAGKEILKGENADWEKAFYRAAQGVSSLTGVGFSSLYRDGKAIIMTALEETGSIAISADAYDRSKPLAERLAVAEEAFAYSKDHKGEGQKVNPQYYTDLLLEIYLTSGTGADFEAAADAAIRQGATERGLMSSFRTKLRAAEDRVEQAAQALLDGDMDEYDRLVAEMVEAGIGGNLINSMVTSAYNELSGSDTGTTDSGSGAGLIGQIRAEATGTTVLSTRAAELLTEDATAEDVTEAIGLYQQDGLTESQIRTRVSGKFKKAYIQACVGGDQAEAQRLRGLMLTDGSGIHEDDLSGWTGADLFSSTATDTGLYWQILNGQTEAARATSQWLYGHFEGGQEAVRTQVLNWIKRRDPATYDRETVTQVLLALGYSRDTIEASLK